MICCRKIIGLNGLTTTLTIKKIGNRNMAAFSNIFKAGSVIATSQNQFWDQTPILGPGGLQPELLDPKSDLDAETCTHSSCRSQLHVDILFLSIRPLITHAEMPLDQALKSNTEQLITLI